MIARYPQRRRDDIERDRSSRCLIWPGDSQRASAVANELIWRMKEVGYRPAKYRVDVPALVIHGDEPTNETYR
jgi:hypothetical protein